MLIPACVCVCVCMYMCVCVCECVCVCVRAAAVSAYYIINLSMILKCLPITPGKHKTSISINLPLILIAKLSLIFMYIKNHANSLTTVGVRHFDH